MNAYVVGTHLFRWFAGASAVLAALSLILVHDWSITLLSLLVNGFFLCTHTVKACRRLPGAIVLAFLNLVYLQFPLLYIGVASSYYDFGRGAMIPRGSETYLEQLVPAMLFFTGCYALLMLGMLLGNVRGARSRMRPLNLRLNRFSLACLVCIGLVVCWVQTGDLRASYMARSAQIEKTERLLAFLFNDKMYLLLFPVLFYLLPLHVKARSSKACFLGMTGLLFFINMYGGSKAAILLVGISFFLYPVAIFYRQGTRIYWPRVSILLAAAMLAVPFYFYAQLDRQFKSTGQVFTIDAAVRELRDAAADAGRGGGALAQIASRLSANVNNFVLIYTEYRHDGDAGYRAEFRRYVWRNFLNLVLLGTPYQDAYVPSSQLLPEVIAHERLESRMDKAEFLRSASTQPYTLFGFFLVSAGPMVTFLASFCFGYVYSSMFNAFRSVINRLLIVFSFTVFYSCYGFEVAAQFAVMMILTTYFAIALLEVCTQLTQTRPALPARASS